MSRLIALAGRTGLSVRETCKNPGPPASKTDQTDQQLESQGEFRPIPGRKLTTRHSELTSAPDHGARAGTLAP